MRLPRPLAAFALLVALACPTPARSARVELGENAWIDLRVLAQIQGQVREAPAGGRESDFFVRRARLVLFGSVTPSVSYFLETDSPNFGRGGNFATRAYVQDVFISFKLAPTLTLDTGLLVVPLTRHTYQGAVSLLGVEFYGSAIRYPADATLVFRDVGVQARGSLLDERIQFRAGAFGGRRKVVGRADPGGQALPDLNPDSLPLLASNLRFNLVGSEPELFPLGIYFGKRKLISVGVGATWQPKAVATGSVVADYLALVGDFYADYPINEVHEIVVQGALLRYRQGATSELTGTGAFLEAGYRYRAVSPVVAGEWFLSRTGRADQRVFHLGIAYWLKEHTVNLKADFALGWDAAAQGVASLAEADARPSLTLQTHLFF